ncbi:hypothetical protein D3C84_467080 [compost metagenome]
MAQANHPGVVEGGGGGRIEASRQLGQALANGRRTDEDQAIGAVVGQHLDGGFDVALAQRSLDHERDISNLGMP